MKYLVFAVLLNLALVNAVQVPVQAQAPASAVTCEICTFVVNLVEGYLQNNATEEQILTNLESDCKLLGNSGWIATCQGIIEAYGPDLITYLIDNETPELACAQVGLCSSASVQITKVTADGVSCIACEFIARTVEGYLANNKSEAEILTLVEKDCSVLGVKSWVTVVCNNWVWG